MHTIRFKLVFSIFMLTAPLILMLFLNNHYVISIVRSEVAASYRQMSSVSMKQIDTTLEEMDKYMNVLVGAGPDLASLSRADTTDAYMRAKIYLFNKLNAELPLYAPIRSMFAYSHRHQDYLEVYSEVGRWEERERVKAYIVDELKDAPTVRGFYSNSWSVHHIGDEWYLLHILQSGDTYIGSWARADDLLQPLLVSSDEKHAGIQILVDDRGKLLTKSELNIGEGEAISWVPDDKSYAVEGVEEKYLIVGEHSRKGNFGLLTVVPDEQILNNLPYLQKIVYVIVIASIIVLPVGFYLLRRSVLVPIYRLIVAMNRLRGGKPDVKIEPFKTSHEFKMMHETFNQMSDEIRNLRIDVYEEQLSKQQEELQRLQLQINPHFFMNSLNLIYHLAKAGKSESIQEMAISITHYFRFMLRSYSTFVRLDEELSVVRHYLRIQQFRFGDSLSSHLSAPDYLLDTPVPPLVVQTFVENSIMHAVSMDEPIQITIQADFHEQDSQAWLELTIRDNGPGFEEKVLVKINDHIRVTDEEGRHIGIWNVQRRLSLLYGDRASLRFSNDNGAVVRLLLPL